jgi:acyl-CoA thioesterase-2
VPEDRAIHSLHGYFLRPGDAGAPIVYEVDRIRDGRSFTTRRVVAVQHGEVIFFMSASFQRSEEGFEHQEPMPSAPDPESLPTFHERFAPYMEGSFGEWLSQPRPFDVRYVEDPPAIAKRTGQRHQRQQVWMRTNGTLPDDPLLHVCLVTYASDLTLLDSVLAGHGLAGWHDDVSGASLDHAMWFHRPFRADEWLLYDQVSPSASGGRGLARGQIYSRDGQLVVSVVQEGLVRLKRK